MDDFKTRLKANQLLGTVARKIKANIDFLMKDEEPNRLVRGIISNKALCLMLSYAFHYHKAVAVTS